MTTSHFLTTAWDWNPWVITLCAAVVVVGAFRFRAEFVWLTLATAVYFFSLCSPIDALANGYLFSAHMLQHLLLLLVVPLFLLLSLPARVAPASGRSLKSLQSPVAWLLGVGGMWLWHAPTLCNAAVSNIWVHRLQYFSLVGMGLAFWWPIMGPWIRQRMAPLTGMIYLFSACLACTVLGIIITFSPVEVCSIYLHPNDRLGILPLIQDQWGMTPAKDQQLGGLLMWVPACLIYFFGILGLLARWYREPGQAMSPAPAEASSTLLEKSHGL